jgi:hypothetical protein
VIAAPVDQSASWGGEAAGIIAAVLFLAFATWIVVQRIRHGRGHDDD